MNLRLWEQELVVASPGDFILNRAASHEIYMEVIRRLARRTTNRGKVASTSSFVAFYSQVLGVLF
jgi:hypothetical protein